jgi:hypothetical protein
MTKFNRDIMGIQIVSLSPEEHVQSRPHLGVGEGSQLLVQEKEYKSILRSHIILSIGEGL